MPTVVVWDVETDRAFAGLRGLARSEQMRQMQTTVACAIVLDAAHCEVPGNWQQAKDTAQLRHWWRDEDPTGKGPFHELLALFDDADVIVAYNGLGFDLPVMRKYYGAGSLAQTRYVGHRIKCLDPMTRVASALDIPFPKLDALLAANNLTQKTGDGLQAIRLWEQGKREELRQYCESDVWLLAELVHLENLRVAQIAVLPNAVHGIASAILRERTLAARPLAPPASKRPRTHAGEPE